MKTPDEIKKGLEWCLKSAVCSPCPYFEDKVEKRPHFPCFETLKADALAYIIQLEHRLADVNASPFDGGMSQAEYFGGGHSDGQT